LNVGKVLLFAKQTQGHAEKTRGAGIEVTQKLYKETWITANNLCWQSVQNTWRIVFENCRCLWNRTSWRLDM